MSLEVIEPLVQNPAPLNREQLVGLIRKWGGVNTDGLLDKGCRVFNIPTVDGFIGYKIEGLNAVVLGEPVCSILQRTELAIAFDKDCQNKNLTIIYTMVSKEFADFAIEKFLASSIEFGTQIILDPQNPPNQKPGSKGVLVRKKVKHASQDGVTVKEYLEDDLAIEKEMETLAKAWVEKRQGPQLFLCGVSLFSDRVGKRWFYAEHQNKIVGLMVLNELQSSRGWLLNNIIMKNEAPKGLSELLIITALEVLNKEGCRYVLAGPVPDEHLKIKGLGIIKESLLRLVFKVISLFFHLSGHTKFWEKFQPETKGSFLVFPHNNVGFSTVLGLMKAFRG